MLRTLPTLAAALVLAAILPAAAQQRPAAPARAAPAAPANAAAPVSNEPQRTTSTFGDWTVRCERLPGGAAPVCEVNQTVYNPQGQPLAQTAIGRTVRTEPFRLTALLPVNVTLTAAPSLLGAENEAGVPPVELAWRRCLPAGCVADAALRDDVLQRLRGRTEASRLVFQDGAGRSATLPFSARGLPQALDALMKDEAR